ncbi:MAG: lantibiotic dehydratase family protein [Marinifilaceae bacterium]
MKHDSFDVVLARMPVQSLEFYHKLINHSQWDELLQYLSHPWIRDSIFVASPVLYQEIVKWEKGQKTEKEIQRLGISLLKYLIRMSTRTSPFGMFSGVAIGEVDSETRVSINTDNQERSVCFGRSFLKEVVEKLIQKETVREQLVYYPNSSLYQTPDSNYRQIEEYRFDGVLKYRMTSIEGNSILEEVIERAEKGLSFQDIVLLFTDNGFEEEESRIFLHDLIEENIFVSELECPTAGIENLKFLLNKLRKCELPEIVSKGIKEIEKFQEKMNQVEGQLAESRRPKLEELSAECSLHVDTQISCSEVKIDRKLVRNIIEAVEVLSCLNGNRFLPIHDFTKKFKNRYGYNRVPLCWALDPEFGIGYNGNGNLTSNDSIIQLLQLKEKQTTQAINRADQLLLKLLSEWDETGMREIELLPEHLETLKVQRELLSDSYCAFAHVFKEEGEERAYLTIAGGGSAASHISRYASLTSECAKLVEDIYAFEQNFRKGKIVAEILHAPAEMKSNVFHRGVARKVGIPILTGRGDMETISIRDLFLQYESDEKLHLYSDTLNCEISPVLSTSHNYSQTQFPIYYFLCDMQAEQQKETGFEFEWREAFNRFNFLPRIRYKNVILTPATWRIDLKSVQKKKQNYDSLELMEEHQLPSKFYLKELDNELLIDMRTAMGKALLEDAVRRNDELTIFEAFETGESVAHNAGGESFNLEFVIPVKNVRK